MTTDDSRGAPAPLDDDALFDAITAGDTLPALGDAEAVPPEPAAPPASEPAPQPAHHVPLSELLNEREKRQALERELADIRRHEVEPVLAPVQTIVMGLTREVAELRYSRDEVAEAERAFNEAAESGRLDPALHHRINTSANPFASAVEWHRQQKVLSEVGGDIAAFRQREREAALNDPEFLRAALERARAQAQPAPVVHRPGSPQPAATLPSVSRMGAAAPISQTQPDMAADDTLWDEVTARRKRA
ncbi:hypothetical protein [Microvirga yunnanensis]|uniref:hypothetical protein n=1 Tax=Microvirga yunnanensis TaxID=2953740 RepID=UPI0021C56A51|nr:hypothetical protein [Microvirga sp. HBU65207]